MERRGYYKYSKGLKGAKVEADKRAGGRGRNAGTIMASRGTKPTNGEEGSLGPRSTFAQVPNFR